MYLFVRYKYFSHLLVIDHHVVQIPECSENTLISQAHILAMPLLTDDTVSSSQSVVLQSGLQYYRRPALLGRLTVITALCTSCSCFHRADKSVKFIKQPLSELKSEHTYVN